MNAFYSTAIVFLGVCAAVAIAVSSQSGNVTFKECQGSLTCGGACQTITYVEGQCVRGSIFGCQNTVKTCLDVTDFNTTAGSTCSSAEAMGPSAIVCDYCFPLSNAQNQVVYAAFRHCNDDSRRAFHYNCTADCSSCTSQVPLHTEQCTVNPINPAQGIRLHKARPCGKLVTIQGFATDDCSGSPSGSNAIPSGQCMWGGSNASSSLSC